MKSINIKGKEYVMVNERIKHFRSSEKYAGYAIITEMVSNVDGVVVFKTTILDNTNRIVSTGYAHEIEGSSNINQTSHIENCETGSVGRALGFLGIGVDTSIATAEEVINAEKREQTAAKPAFEVRRTHTSKPNDVNAKTLDLINNPDMKPKLGDRAFIEGHNAVVRQNRTTGSLFWCDENPEIKWTKPI